MGNENSTSSSGSWLKDVVLVSPYILAALVTSNLPTVKFRPCYVHEVHF